MPQLIRALEKTGVVWLAAMIVAVSALAQPTPRPTAGVLGSANLIVAGTMGPDGRYYDYILLTGGIASVDPADDTVARTYFIDANDDIVSVDFSGAGTISFAMESWTGPALPAKYNQNVSYIKGAASITVMGADATTRLKIFAVGRSTAVNQALFRTDVTYDGVADLQSVAIVSVGPGRFGDLDASNARFSGALGVVGIVAPETTFTGPVAVHDMEATGLGMPGLRLGSAANVRICGGDLFQPNGKSVSVSGFAELKMVEGTTSHDVRLAARPLGGLLAAKAAVVVTPIELTFVAGQDGAQIVSAFGSPAPSFGLAGGGFPSWAQLDASTGRITGAPPDTAGSPFTFKIRVSNGGGLFTDANVTLAVTPAAVVAPVLESPLHSAAVNLGGTHTFSAKVNGTAPITYQWSRNGAVIEGATSPALHLAEIGVADAGFYSFIATNSAGSVEDDWAHVGIVSPTKVGGAAVEVGSNITHPNGKRYDQILLQGTQATIQSQDGDVTRLSFIDLNDDIVQLEFSGRGTLSLVLEEASGPATAIHYVQPVTYMKGHAGIIITSYDETTNLSITSVGRLTAFDPTGKWDMRKPVSEANDPAANGNPIFQADVRYDGIADLAYVVLIPGSNKFGGIRAAGASFFAHRGYTGIYAPTVEFHGPVFVGDIDAFDSAQPVLVLGSATDVRITGGALAQTNGAPVQVSGLAQLRFVDGTNSHGVLLPAQHNQGLLKNRGTDVTNQIVVNP
jgi:hypothetical protein